MTLLEGKVAMVTGAGRGIGASIATTLADHGAHVVLAARSREAMEEQADSIRKTGRCALVAYLDLLTPETVHAAVAAALGEFGRIDVLVCNSGIAGPSAALWELDDAEWNDTLAVNVTGVYLCCKAVIPSMIANGGGSIVVIGSMSGKVPLLHRAAYTTSKLAVVGLVRTLAMDAGRFGVRVNTISPGPVEGARLDRVVENLATAREVSVAQARADFRARSPMGRLVSSHDVAEATAFLASDLAKATTGEDLNVSSGICMS